MADKELLSRKDNEDNAEYKHGYPTDQVNIRFDDV